MTVLALTHYGAFVRFISTGSWFELPGGRQVSPAYAGWQSDDGYALEAYTPPTPPAPTPEQIRADMPPLTARQLRLGLVRDGKTLSQVEAAIDAIPDPQAREEARIEWEYATSYERVHPLILSIAAAFGYTPEQVDALWTLAATY